LDRENAGDGVDAVGEAEVDAALLPGEAFVGEDRRISV